MARLIVVVGMWYLATGAAVAGRIDPEEAARGVFAAREFWWKRSVPMEKPSMTWLESIWKVISGFFGAILDVVGKWLAAFFIWLFGSIPTGATGASLWVWVIVVLLAGWLVWKLYPFLLRWLRREKVSAATRDQTAWQTLPEAADLLEQAGQAFGAGRNAQAIRLALLALIARLETQGVLRYDHTRTNREYQAELRRTPQLAGPFGEVAEIYDQVWYGRMPAGQEAAERAMRVSGAVILGEGRARE